MAGTGCTVVTFPPGTVASGEVRGGAPATREFALLDPCRTVPGPDALVLTGGSAFGLAAADGVVRWCEERGRGFATPAGPVPIVVAMALYDLGVGDAVGPPGRRRRPRRRGVADLGPPASRPGRARAPGPPWPRRCRATSPVRAPWSRRRPGWATWWWGRWWR